MTSVAVLGLGVMGRAMAMRLLGAGHELAVWNRTPGRDDELVAAGARRGATPADAVRDAEVVISMLTGPPALEEVVFGPDGAAEAIGDDATLIEMSTVGPEPVRALAERIAPTAVLDAPVLGSAPSVEAGRLTVLVGGDGEVFERHRELLETFGTVAHVGPLGVGATLKLVSNASSLAAYVAIVELLALTDRRGVDETAILDGLEMSPLASLVARWRVRLEDRYERPDFTLALARKDLALVLEEAERAGVRLSLIEAMAARFDEAMAAGLGDRDVGSVTGFLRRR